MKMQLSNLTGQTNVRSALCLKSTRFHLLADMGLTTQSEITQCHSLFIYSGIKQRNMCYIPVVSSYNDGECLQLTKVSSLMNVLYLACVDSMCPQFNQRPGSHGNDTEHLDVYDLANCNKVQDEKHTQQCQVNSCIVFFFFVCVCVQLFFFYYRF